MKSSHVQEAQVHVDVQKVQGRCGETESMLQSPPMRDVRKGNKKETCWAKSRVNKKRCN